MIELRVNGESHRVDAHPDMPLLWYLRDELGLTGAKLGCQVAACGACTVHVDGRAVRSCQVPLAGLQGRTVTTIEGLDANGAHPLQEAWRALHVGQSDHGQCGYCQPGQIMQAAWLLSTVPAPSDEDIDTAMAGNLCRCRSYARIRAAIRRAAAVSESA
jgi:isoquinoline 1-oxidoreductase alpha subunit